LGLSFGGLSLWPVILWPMDLGRAALIRLWFYK
jgi:hypothetical protein